MCIADDIVDVKLVADNTFSPHSPVRLYMKTKVRRTRVRNLAAPKAFDVHAPCGPLPKPEDFGEAFGDTNCTDLMPLQDEAATPSRAAEAAAATAAAAAADDLEYKLCIERIESELASLSGLTGRKLAEHTGRANGVGYKWTHASTEQPAGSSRTTAMSRAWRRTSKWLRDLQRCKCPTRADGIRWRILYYAHERPPPNIGTEQLQDAMFVFDLWRGQLRWSNLHYPPALEMMAAAAERQAQTEEAAACKHAFQEFLSWLKEGPAGGLRRQHRFTRVCIGWQRTKECGTEGNDELTQRDDLDGISQSEIVNAIVEEQSNTAIASTQREANQEARAWAAQWGVGCFIDQPVVWPDNIMEQHSPMLVDTVLRAANTFPSELGLGWDALHPRLLTRVSRSTVEMLIRIILRAERCGRWPAKIGILIIVLVPKDDGGFRPIGLLPFITKVWMKARREVGIEWERQQARPYLFAGEHKGADIAAWKQAARAELAATASCPVGYAQALLDLIKAFERIPHSVLASEAKKLGYRLRMLTLSIATYILTRVIRIGTTVSIEVTAIRGITAGSGMATTEMRIVLINLIDATLIVHPTVVITLYVDDISAEMTGPDKHIEKELGDCILEIADGVTANQQELSRTKCVCTASTDTLGKALELRWSPLEVKYKRYVKSLGVGLGGGTRRTTKVLSDRLRKFKMRIPKFKRLRRLGICPARIIRTGGKAGFVYGQAIMGVPDHLLRDQRRAVAAAAALEHGSGGQQLDLALVIADGGPRGSADPAFDAHILPLSYWAAAVWEERLPRASLERMIARAKLNIAKAKRVWHVVRGPAAALVVTCSRIGWKVNSALQLTTHEGRQLDLTVDPPAVIEQHARYGVVNWRNNNIRRSLGTLPNPGGGGIFFEPIWQLLRAKKSKKSDDNWGTAEKGALRSVTTNRQYTQVRCKAAGWADHGKCIACVHRIAGELGCQCQLQRTDDDGCMMKVAKVDTPAAVSEAATNEVLALAPDGTLFHRSWICKSLDEHRQKEAPPEDIARTKSGWGSGDPAWERALAPMPPLPSRKRMEHETFHWIVKPQNGILPPGDIYVDGSALDGPYRQLIRCGWGFVMIDALGNITAAARGVPPPWIDDIGGAEGWALLQAATNSIPGQNRYLSDCKSGVDVLFAGKEKACAAKCKLARIYALILAAFDDDAKPHVIWMPAHKKDEQAGTLTIGNGEPLSLVHILGNRAVDTMAKMAVAEHRADFRTVQEWSRTHQVVTRRAKWIARSTVLANDLPDAPYRDTEASRVAADRIKQQRAAGKPMAKVVKRQWIERTPELGGHALIPTIKHGSRSGWRCQVCKHQGADYKKLSSQRCDGSAASRWAMKALQLADAEVLVGRGHTRVLSGTTLWCLTCGAFADTKAVGLTAECKGAPSVHAQGHYGGMWGQKQKLLKNIHPRLGTSLPYPIFEDGTFVHSTGQYPNLPANRAAPASRQDQAPLLDHVVDTGKRGGTHAPGKSARQKAQERLERVRAKERRAVLQCEGRRFRLTGKQSVKAQGNTDTGRVDRGGGVWEWAFSDEPR